MNERNSGTRPFRLLRFLHVRWPFMANFYSLSKLGFPFMLPDFRASAMRRLRARARREIFAHHPPVRRWLERMTMTLSWPFGALVDTVYNLRISGAFDHPRSFPDLMVRAGHMLTLALFENVPPFEYVAYRLNEPWRRERASEYLYWSEDNIFRVLNNRNGADNDDVQDKGRFADICRQHGLPCIPTLAIYRGGRQIFPDAPFIPSQPALWVKDLAGSRGSGAGQWRRQEGDYTYAGRGIATPEELADSWRKQNCIIQPVIDNHPDLACLSDGTLAEIRIITGVDPEGNAQLITHQMTIPWGGFANRPFSVLGILDDDGRISRAISGDGKPVERHPETGAPIAGTVVPFWREARELVSRAHGQAFSHFVFLGWDVAITAEGPVLIETNSNPGVFHHQFADDIPLGHTVFATIASRHFERAETCD